MRTYKVFICGNFVGMMRMYDNGPITDKVNYIVMELLGDSIKEIARKQSKTFSLKTVC